MIFQLNLTVDDGSITVLNHCVCVCIHQYCTITHVHVHFWPFPCNYKYINYIITSTSDLCTFTIQLCKNISRVLSNSVQRVLILCTIIRLCSTISTIT